MAIQKEIQYFNKTYLTMQNLLSGSTADASDNK